MAIVDVDGSILPVDSQSKLVDLSESRWPPGTQSAFIK